MSATEKPADPLQLNGERWTLEGLAALLGAGAGRMALIVVAVPTAPGVDGFRAMFLDGDPLRVAGKTEPGLQLAIEAAVIRLSRGEP